MLSAKLASQNFIRRRAGQGVKRDKFVDPKQRVEFDGNPLLQLWTKAFVVISLVGVFIPAAGRLRNSGSP